MPTDPRGDDPAGGATSGRDADGRSSQAPYAVVTTEPAHGRSPRTLGLIAAAALVVVIGVASGGRALLGRSDAGPADARAGTALSTGAAGAAAPTPTAGESTPATPTPAASAAKPASPTPSAVPTWPTGPRQGLEDPSALTDMPMAKYTDPRFGFTVPVGTKMRMESSADDNTTWRWGEARLVVWGENSPQTKAEGIAGLERAGAQIATSRGDDSNFVISGYLGDRIFYELVLSGSASSNWLYWEYPRSLKAQLDKPVSTSANGFLAGDMSTTH